MPKVLHVTEATDGGAARYLLDAASRGGSHTVILIAGRYGTGRSEEQLVADGIPFLRVHPRAVASRKVLRLIRSHDVVILHAGITGIFGRLAGILRLVPSARLVYVPNASFGYRSRPWAVVERVLTSLSKTVTYVFLTSGERVDYEERFGSVGGRGFVVRPFLRTQPRDIGVTGSTLRLVVLGRITEQKDPKRVAGFLSDLANVSPFHCTWIGDGPMRDSFLASLSERTKGSVDITGWIDDPMEKMREIRPHFNVLLSRFESFGYSILEGMSLGIPAVTSSFQSSAELIEDGANGFLVDHRTSDRMAKSLIDGSYSAMRAAAIDTASSFTAGRFDEGFGAAIEHVMSGHLPGGRS